MTELDRMGARLAIVETRLRRVEDLLQPAAGEVQDGEQAAAVAARLGFGQDVFLQKNKVSQRQRLAGELRLKGWSVTRISQVLHCAERSVWRLIPKSGTLTAKS